MNHGPTFGERAVGVWMDLVHPALVDAAQHNARPSAATLAKWEEATSSYGSAARAISAQLLAAVHARI